jgi:hypothetical protein
MATALAAYSHDLKQHALHRSRGAFCHGDLGEIGRSRMPMADDAENPLPRKAS